MGHKKKAILGGFVIQRRGPYLSPPADTVKRVTNCGLEGRCEGAVSVVGFRGCTHPTRIISFARRQRLFHP